MSSLSDNIVLLRSHLDNCEAELKKLESGRKSSSAKSRAELMKMKKLSHSMRAEITKFTKELPTKKRVSKDKVEDVAEIVLENSDLDKSVALPIEVKTEKKTRKPRTKKTIVEK